MWGWYPQALRFVISVKIRKTHWNLTLWQMYRAIVNKICHWASSYSRSYDLESNLYWTKKSVFALFLFKLFFLLFFFSIWRYNWKRMGFAMQYEYGIRKYCYRRIIFSVIMHNAGLKNKYSVKHRKDFLFGFGVRQRSGVR